MYRPTKPSPIGSLGCTRLPLLNLAAGPASYAAFPKGHDSIVILSANADAHFVEEAKKIGARAYIAKTKAAEALVTAIETAINDGEFVLLA
jgi:DNA-binding NarL/FixJ family response regulator